MSAFIINGGRPLFGTVTAQGSKNSAVAVLIASIITDGVSEIYDVPDILDVRVCLELLGCLGIKTEFSNGKVTLDTGGVKKTELPHECINKMRASSYLIGAELARFGECTLPDSGGCNFGSRPVNYHINAMRSLGAICNGDRLVCNKLTGNTVRLPYPSVGATVNTIIAASKADGMTIIENTAREPHIEDLAKYLNSCGAEISGAGTACVIIKGNKKLHGGSIKLCPDMIETGTYLIYGLMTHGRVTVKDTAPYQLSSLFDVFDRMGISTEVQKDTVTVYAKNPRSTDITTSPYPGFPTDLQPQISALLGMSDGISHINETVFAQRFGYTRSLSPFGFSCNIENSVLKIKGAQYKKACSRATDLRGGAAVIGTALSAKGESVIENVQLVMRGYSDIVEKLTALGAEIVYKYE